MIVVYAMITITNLWVRNIGVENLLPAKSLIGIMYGIDPPSCVVE
jgi:hypothetical protein